MQATASEKLLQQRVFSLVTRDEVEALAILSGYTQRRDRGIPPFEFVLACLWAATSESRRSFASVWRFLLSTFGIDVARSAVTQRFDQGSADLMETLFLLALERLELPSHPELLGKLAEFKQVLAHDGSVIQLAAVLKKLCPATRTNSVDAAAKLHATVDLVHRRIQKVVLTGERESELAVAKREGIVKGVLYLNDLGYFEHDYFQAILLGEADMLSRLKENSNPVVTHVRHGIVGPVSSVGMKLNDLRYCRTQETFDLDARFETSSGGVELRVVGQYNPETEKYHCYVTTLKVEQFSVMELVILYTLRWVIELFFKLMKTSLHLDHVETGNAQAVRTHLYASLLASVVLTAVTGAAAKGAKMPVSRISPLVVGIAAPLLAMPLALLWLGQDVTKATLADMILRTISKGCVDQNINRTQEYWGLLS
jgi:putative transposase